MGDRTKLIRSMIGKPGNNREASEPIVMEDTHYFLCLTPLDNRWDERGFPPTWSGCFC